MASYGHVPTLDEAKAAFTVVFDSNEMHRDAC
jgi:hypothetical protein